MSRVTEISREMLGSEIPESFEAGMAAIARGDTEDFNEVMSDLDAEFEGPK